VPFYLNEVKVVKGLICFLVASILFLVCCHIYAIGESIDELVLEESIDSQKYSRDKEEIQEIIKSDCVW
jgi:hypothetical protein